MYSGLRTLQEVVVFLSWKEAMLEGEVGARKGGREWPLFLLASSLSTIQYKNPTGLG